MTIKRIMLVLLATLSCLLIFSQGRLFYEAYSRYIISKEASNGNQAVDTLLDGANYLAIERGVTNSALNNSDIASPEILKKIADAREAFNKEAAEYTEQASAAGMVVEDHYQQSINKAFEAVKALRQAVDANLSKPKAERDTQLMANWMPGITALIVETQNLRINLASQTMSKDSSMAKETMIRHNIWLMTEYAGRERGVLAGVIVSGEPISPEQTQKLLGYRGKVEEGWNALTNMYMNKEEHAAFDAPIAAARDNFFGSFEKVRQAVYADAKLGVGYNITAKDWISQSTQAIDTLNKIQETTTDYMDSVLEMHGSEASNGMMLYGLLLFSSVLAVVVALWVVLRRVLSPIHSLSVSMNTIAAGKYDQTVPYLARTDEIGNMAKSVEVFRNNGIEKIRLEEEQKQVEIRAQQEKKKAQNDLANRFESQVQGIISTVAAAATQLYQTAESMSKIIEFSSDKAGNVANASGLAAQNVQSVAAAAEEMTATVKEIAGQLAKSSTAVKETVQEVNKADGIAILLSEATQKIGEIVDVIQNIAGQINLLALNATIESARAGEAGKGFAVVASEVKNLATQTAKSTDEITSHVQSIQEVSRQVVEVLQLVKKSVANVDEYSAAISAAVEEQSATNNEISSSMNKASVGTQQINNDISEVSKASAEASAAAVQTLDAARMVSVEAEKLSQEVSSFLSSVRNG